MAAVIAQQPGFPIRSWDEISAEFIGDEPNGALVVGNGLSRAVWEGFSYESLREKASGVAHPLTSADVAIFTALGTSNFEYVLEAIHKATVVAKARGEDANALEEHYQRIRRALVEAVKDMHVPWDWLSLESRKSIGTTMRGHATVYSVNYDLIPYWCVMATGVRGFVDYFFSADHSFDSKWLPPLEGRTRLLFVHGALHLVRRWNDVAAKLANDGRSLLEQFGDEPESEPLFVSEGTSAEKRAAIRRSDYLSFVYEQLAIDPGPFVLFGVGLPAQDSHIAAALNRKDLRIAIALHGDEEQELLARAAGYVQVLNRTSLTFFRASTHPLGDASLAALEPEAPIATDAEAAGNDWDELYRELFGDDWPG